ncbi:MAG: transcriptional regulator, GntR family, partial [Variovorax sp.]|nr:transcriptional regulator, GntR family [Variovorax sp.]
SKLPNTHALSLPRHKAILTALLSRDSLAARQATLVQLEETRGDLSVILDAGIDLA